MTKTTPITVEQSVNFSYVFFFFFCSQKHQGKLPDICLPVAPVQVRRVFKKNLKSILFYYNYLQDFDSSSQAMISLKVNEMRFSL